MKLIYTLYLIAKIIAVAVVIAILFKVFMMI